MRRNGERLGVIGAGNIGGAIAMNLVADGHRVVVHDADPRRCGALVAAGAAVAANPAEVAAESAITFTSLPGPAAMEAVAGQWLEAAPRGAVLVDLTTNAPTTVRRVGDRFAAAERGLLEAPLSGGAVGAQNRQLVFMTGGDRAIYESLAICEYLAARHGSDLIVAPDEPERPEFVQWLLYGEATLQAPLSAMARVRRIRNTTPEMQAGIDAVLSDARHSLSMRVKLLEQRLEGRDFLVVGRMTLADISVGYPLNNMGKPDFASLLGPRATAYRERLLARPAFQRAAAVP